jgi:hypothetical protein
MRKGREIFKRKWKIVFCNTRLCADSICEIIVAFGLM